MIRGEFEQRGTFRQKAGGLLHNSNPKADVLPQVKELSAALKTRSHLLCMRTDQMCLQFSFLVAKLTWDRNW